MRPAGVAEGIPAAVSATGEIPARVPGCVHTDLMRAGLIPDPRIAANDLDLLWIGRGDWEYRCVFDLTPELLAGERLDLACDGLDTIAELSLNGRPVGSAANAFHPHRFDLRSVARAGMNELAITFRSPVRHVLAEQARLGALPHNGDGLGWLPYQFIRKPACNFGWDWAPNVATCGIAGGIRVEAWSGVRIAGVRTGTIADQDRHWTLRIGVDLDWALPQLGPRGVLIGACLRDGGDLDEWSSLAPESCVPSIDLSIRVESPRLWWPRGKGEPFLHSLEVGAYPTKHSPSMRDSAWHVLHSWNGSVGFRASVLDVSDDSSGAKFEVGINGMPVFCKGANWIPEGLFHDDRSDERVRERVRQAAAASMNMLRVWGGGAYESDAFYDECDRQGIMVWQDFMFACACYPEEGPFPELVEREARHQIARLSTHPSVVLWCGGNECVWGHECWGYAKSDVAGPWKERTRGRGWGDGYWFDLLARLLRELDPSRPYWPNSPFGGALGEHPNQSDRGNRHTWDARPGTEAFRTASPRFCTEFGVQSPPVLETLAGVVSPAELRPDSPSMHHRQRGTGGMAAHIDEALAAWLGARAGDPSLDRQSDESELARWIRLVQTMQAEALRDGIEWLASNRPRCMGALVWQLNDAWPGMSWSLIDSAGRPKPAYFAVRDAFATID